LSTTRITGRLVSGDGHQAARQLVRGLLVLGIRRAVVDDAGAGLEAEPPSAQGDAADDDREVHVSVEADVAGGPGVRTPREGLQLVDDLQRPDLRRTAHGAGGERGGDDVPGIESGVERSRDLADHVHHVAVALDDLALLHLHRARAADAADVVASEVDEHHVLGALLRVGRELGLERRVLGGGRAAHARAGDGAHGDGLTGEAHQELGRGAGERAVAEPEEEEVGVGETRRSAR
jgi:hypothetical protein